MGSCLSSPTKEGTKASSDKPKPKTGHHGAHGHSKPKPAAPDAMLAKYFEYVQQLGKGGTGDTGLFKDLSGGEEVAIKLIKRPLPKVIMPNILREVTVSWRPKASECLRDAFEVLYCTRNCCTGSRSSVASSSQLLS